jgi:hypothetical protein
MQEDESGQGQPGSESEAAPENAAPKYEEMSPRQQEVHDTATKREAEDISEEVKQQEAAVEFAREKLGDETAQIIKKDLINVDREEAEIENVIEDYGRNAAHAAILVMTTAGIKGQPYERGILPRLENRAALNKAVEILGAEPDQDYNGKEVSQDTEVFESHTFTSPLGTFAFYERDIPTKEGPIRASMVRGFPKRPK